jgi:hypothetical protein
MGINTVNKRPELQLFDLQSEQKKNTISNNFKVNAFAGRLNPMLDNSFQTFTCSVQRRTGMCLIGINLKRKRGTTHF